MPLRQRMVLIFLNNLFHGLFLKFKKGEIFFVKSTEIIVHCGNILPKNSFGKILHVILYAVLYKWFEDSFCVYY